MTAAKRIILAVCLVVVAMAHASALCRPASENRVWEKISPSPEGRPVNAAQDFGWHQDESVLRFQLASEQTYPVNNLDPDGRLAAKGAAEFESASDNAAAGEDAIWNGQTTPEMWRQAGISGFENGLTFDVGFVSGGSSNLVTIPGRIALGGLTAGGTGTVLAGINDFSSGQPITADSLYSGGVSSMYLGAGGAAFGEGLSAFKSVVPQGTINYGSLDSLGRPTGVTATITQDMIGTGSAANASIIPPGWSGNGTLFNEARGHLLGAQLGGSGDIPENLVTLQQNPANSPVMRGFENQVRATVEGGQAVNYSVTPIYNGNNLVPRGITIIGTGSDGFSLGVSVLNPIGR